jgi:uncharacterized protein YqkB
MKQLLPLFLLLLPCLAWAQYPSNGNQKITLGEQTTADGLIYRGVAATDTVRKPSIDTMAYMVLDTTTNIMWHYKKATSNAWLRLNLLPSDTASMLTNYWRAGRFSGTLAVANGGTNASTFTAGSVVFAGASGTYTQNNSGLFWDNTNKRLGIGTNSPTENLHFKNSAGTGVFFRFEDVDGGGVYIGGRSNRMELYAGGLERLRIQSSGNVGIGTLSPLALLNVMGTIRINSASAPDANYYLQLENSSSQKAKANAWDTYSDSRIKTNRQPIINAIDKINLLNPTYYNQHDSYVENDLLNIDYNNSYKSLGFIAQEVYEVIPEAVNMGTTNELWAMDYTKLIPILTKAIQEQQALIKALEQRIINLENK